jgi:predicted lipoprotein with Yx(FWY)xxD motif
VRRILVGAAALTLGAGLSACGGVVSATGGTTQVVVKAASIPGLGRVLVDGAGYTLYAYMPDHRGRSRCHGMCAHQWPPLVLGRGQRRAVAGDGVRPSLVGSVPRGGGHQVSYAGWPLYTFINDASPGQATGQANDMGAWYTVSTSGAIDRDTVRAGSG